MLCVCHHHQLPKQGTTKPPASIIILITYHHAHLVVVDLVHVGAERLADLLLERGLVALLRGCVC
jgi:hypothetical protein